MTAMTTEEVEQTTSSAADSPVMVYDSEQAPGSPDKGDTSSAIITLRMIMQGKVSC